MLMQNLGGQTKIIMVFSQVAYSWFALTWLDGHDGVQNKSKMSLAFCIIIEPNPQDFFAIVQYTSMATDDVRCEPRIFRWKVFLKNYEQPTLKSAIEPYNYRYAAPQPTTNN